ncbi:4'-phosphopantetheinyl transferase [Cristinia sonorae]|uniref:4'-phosphopantetheinyl transferase n=1 Tax=Cristinia sonorae TaxID=1940300 RepID=A0A8K0XTW6_9AGAR|nr:4'-phosphopantetheinyl transferase [Cristinia sonorae]
MGIIGIGVDVVSISRIAALVQRRTYDRLAKRILSPGELSEWLSIPATDDARRTRYLAVRWSVKESAYKALYPVRSSWKDFTLTSFDRNNGRKPTMIYHSFGGHSCKYALHASVSHDAGLVFTTVVVESASTDI